MNRRNSSVRRHEWSLENVRHPIVRRVAAGKLCEMITLLVSLDDGDRGVDGGYLTWVSKPFWIVQ